MRWDAQISFLWKEKTAKMLWSHCQTAALGQTERGGEMVGSPLNDAQRESERRRQKIREENERYGVEWWMTSHHKQLGLHKEAGNCTCCVCWHLLCENTWSVTSFCLCFCLLCLFGLLSVFPHLGLTSSFFLFNIFFYSSLLIFIWHLVGHRAFREGVRMDA